MANALNYAQQYQQALANAFPYSLYFGDLWNQTSQGKYKWVDEKQFRFQDLQQQVVSMLTETQSHRHLETMITHGRQRHLRTRESGLHLYTLRISTRQTR